MSFCPTRLPKRDLALRGNFKTSQLVFFMDDPQKLSGRPPKAEGKRIRKIDVRFTDQEYRQIEAMEKEFGMSKTDLVRLRLLSRGTAVVVNARLLLSEVDTIGTELGRAGNNINQLAHHANTLRLQGALNSMVVDHFNELMEDYLRIQTNLEICLRKVIREMSRQPDI